LVARGYNQKEDIDYTEYESIRTLLAVAALKNLELRQFDIKTAFLYGELDEEIFMQLPEGVMERDTIVKLKKLYMA